MLSDFNRNGCKSPRFNHICPVWSSLQSFHTQKLYQSVSQDVHVFVGVCQMIFMMVSSSWTSALFHWCVQCSLIHKTNYSYDSVLVNKSNELVWIVLKSRTITELVRVFLHNSFCQDNSNSYFYLRIFFFLIKVPFITTKFRCIHLNTLKIHLFKYTIWAANYWFYRFKPWKW